MGRLAYFVRLPRRLDELSIRRADGRSMKLLKQLAKNRRARHRRLELALLDDAHRRELLGVLDDRYASRLTIVASQLPIEHWFAAISYTTVDYAKTSTPRRHAYGTQFALERVPSLRGIRIRYTSTRAARSQQRQMRGILSTPLSWRPPFARISQCLR